MMDKIHKALSFQKRVSAAQIVPEGTVFGRTLLVLIAIMSFLSSLTAGAVVMVQQSANAWSSEIGQEVTIQLSPTEGLRMEERLDLAAQIARSIRGVAEVRIVPQDQSLALLEPWLGEGFSMAELPVPRLIEVRLSDSQNFDVLALDAALIASVPEANLDSHVAWRSELNTMAGTVVVTGLVALGLILFATVLSVVFATRGTITANRDIVEVLHFIGASNQFIGKEFQGRFLTIGFKGGMAGGVVALFAFSVLALVIENTLSSAASAQLSFLFGRFSLGWFGLVVLICIVLLIAILTAATSRVTVKRYLAQVS